MTEEEVRKLKVGDQVRLKKSGQVITITTEELNYFEGESGEGTWAISKHERANVLGVRPSEFELL